MATAGSGHTASAVVGWGENTYGQANIPSGLSNVVAVAAVSSRSLALTAEGRVVGWGWNIALTNIPSDLSNAVAIAVGHEYDLALRADGTVVGWGDNTYGQTNIPSGLSNVVAVAAGAAHCLALTSAGRVVGWGRNDTGETNIPSGLSNVVAIAAGNTHSLALTAEGWVVGWGNDYWGQASAPGGLDNVVAIAAQASHSLALTAEGRVVAWGIWSATAPVIVPSGLSNLVAIAVGHEYDLALRADGTVVGWGDNTYGQTNIPSGLSNVVAVAAGGGHSLALKSDEPPAITGQPVSQSVIVGGTASFRVWTARATGEPLVSYQWQQNGTNLAGQTNADLRLDGVTATHAGSYSAIVRNFGGHSTTSSVATLAVYCLLNVSAGTGGSVTRNPDLPAYTAGSQTDVTATPTTSYGFIRWTGDATGSANPLTVVMVTNKNLTAVFASTALTLASQGVGTIAKVPDQPSYSVGEPVTLTATAGRWHGFSAWLDGPTSNPRTVTIGESNAYTAVFTPTTPLETVIIGGVSRLAPVGMPAVTVDGLFILTPSASARGSALVELSTTLPGGTLLYTLDGTDPAVSGSLYAGPFTVGRAALLRTIAYNADFTQSVAGDPVSIVILPTLTAVTDGGGSVAVEPPAGDYFSNSLAVATATPAPGWTFLQWLGDASGTNPVVSLTMTRNKSVRAMFGTPLNTATVGSGSIVVDPVSPFYPYASQVRLTPVPATGNYHALWANAAAGRTNNPLTFTVTNANPTVTAVFASLGSAQTNALAVIPDGRGHVTLTPPGNRYRLNTNVVLQATAEAGQEFLGWSGAASGSENPLIVTMNSNKVITASFTKRPWLHGEGSPDLLGQEGFRLTLTGEFGALYQVFGSLDLGDWTPLGTVSNAWGTVQFTDSDATNAPARFYRARAVE